MGCEHLLKLLPYGDNSTGSFNYDCEEVDFNQLLSRFPRDIIANAGIPLKLHWFVVIDRAGKETILGTLAGAGLKQGEDFFRVWGVKSNQSGGFKYSRIVIELPWETPDKALQVMREYPLFHKGYVLCRWCQFAQGNHISEQMGGSRKLRGRVGRPRNLHNYLQLAQPKHSQTVWLIFLKLGVVRIIVQLI